MPLVRLPLATGPQKRIHELASRVATWVAEAWTAFQAAADDRMDRQSSAGGKGSYRNCSKIFDPHGDGPSIGPTDLTGHSLEGSGTLFDPDPWPGQKLSNLGSNDPIFRAASSSMLQSREHAVSLLLWLDRSPSSLCATRVDRAGAETATFSPGLLLRYNLNYGQVSKG